MQVNVELDGLPYIVAVPDDAQPEDYDKGLIVGPPENLADILLDSWNIEEVAFRLHKELYARGMIVTNDLMKNRASVTAAIISVLKLDVERLIEIYAGGHNGS